MKIYDRNPYTVDAVQIPEIACQIEEFTSFIQDLQRMFNKTVFGWEIANNNYVSVRCLNNAKGVNTQAGASGWIVKSGKFGEMITAIDDFAFTSKYTLKTEEENNE